MFNKLTNNYSFCANNNTKVSQMESKVLLKDNIKKVVSSSSKPISELDNYQDCAFLHLLGQNFQTIIFNTSKYLL